MARPKQETLDVVEQPSRTPRFVLKKNHGLTVLGKPHRFYVAGTEFDADKDGELISQLVQAGAQFE